MSSVVREVDQQHKSLIIKLCDMMDPNNPTYKNFIVFLGASIPTGRLSRVQEKPTEVFALMEEVGFLKAGEYQRLKKALEASGYINILDILKNEEKRITRQKRKRRYSDDPVADGSSNIEAATMSSVKPEGHVMISYRRVEKEKAFWIKRVLQKNGYSVWIDDDNLGSRIFQGMANGVEGAHVVLLCMSEEYKKSEFCRSEAEQAKTIKKNIIPVKVEDVALDGWLGIVTAGYLFVDLSGPHPSEEQMKLLLRKLAEYYSKEFQECQIKPFVSNVVPDDGVSVAVTAESNPIQASTSDATTTTLQGSSTQTMQPATTSPTDTLTPSISTPQTASVSATSTASCTTLIPTETMTGSSGATSSIQETPTTTADISTTEKHRLTSKIGYEESNKTKDEAQMFVQGVEEQNVEQPIDDDEDNDPVPDKGVSVTVADESKPIQASTSAATTTTLQGSSTQTMQPATTSPTATLTPSTSTPQTTSVSATSTASSTTLIPTETMTGSSGATSLIQETPTTTADISTTGVPKRDRICPGPRD